MENGKVVILLLGLREGDTLVITSIDRLSRNKEDIKQELQWFKNHKIRLMILDLPTSMIEVARLEDKQIGQKVDN